MFSLKASLAQLLVKEPEQKVCLDVLPVIPNDYLLDQLFGLSELSLLYEKRSENETISDRILNPALLSFLSEGGVKFLSQVVLSRISVFVLQCEPGILFPVLSLDVLVLR